MCRLLPGPREERWQLSAGVETAESEMVAALASTFSVFGPTSPQVLQKGKGLKTQAGPHAIRQGSQQLSECRLHLAEALIL